MLKIFWSFLILVAIALPLHAELYYEGGFNPDQNLQEYFSEAYPNYNKSIIYIFYNDEPCYSCPQAIAMIEDVYDKYYSQKYSLFIINYQDDREYNFIENYNLEEPLEVVLVKVDDGATFGYKKLENLQNQISDPVSFSENLRYQINSFLGTD